MVETDKIFPEDVPTQPMTTLSGQAVLKTMKLKGSVLEFVLHVEELFVTLLSKSNKKMVGLITLRLEQTQQFIPSYAGWHEGAFALWS